ncbi:MAG: hypothetical protein LBR14_04860 [Clostridiales Family XIII bacterium]|jgi:hypothetical protein|nr:hypothetical protein [Clostridiales Family XIII bacterium]
MGNVPDFYLTCIEVNYVFDVRSCYIERRLRIGNNNDYLLTRVCPPILPDYETIEVSQVLLAVRFVGSTLFPINEWPMEVYVCKMLDEAAILTGTATASDFEVILWGRLHKSYDEAKRETDWQARDLAEFGDGLPQGPLKRVYRFRQHVGLPRKISRKIPRKSVHQ